MISRRECDGLLRAEIGDSLIYAWDTTPEAEAAFAVMVKQAEEAHVHNVRAVVARLDREIAYDEAMRADAEAYKARVAVKDAERRGRLAARYGIPAGFVEDFMGRLRGSHDPRLCVCEGGRSPQCDACIRNE